VAAAHFAGVSLAFRVLLAFRIALGKSEGGHENGASDWSVPLQFGTICAQIRWLKADQMLKASFSDALIVRVLGVLWRPEMDGAETDVGCFPARNFTRKWATWCLLPTTVVLLSVDMLLS
jgi:hypothetical protein